MKFTFTQSLDFLIVAAGELYGKYDRFSIQMMEDSRTYLIGHQYMQYEPDHEEKIILIERLVEILAGKDESN